jgi:hypothetical protein
VTFCRQGGVNKHSFYLWRRIANCLPVRFAELTTTPVVAPTSALEVVLTTGSDCRSRQAWTPTPKDRTTIEDRLSSSPLLVSTVWA